MAEIQQCLKYPMFGISIVFIYFETKSSEKNLTLTMTAWPVYTNTNLLFDKKKKKKLANIQPSLKFYGMIILVKTVPLCRGMA